MYSALKHNGRPLYEYAREGIEIEREARPITIFELKLLSFEGDEVRLEVHCSKGTYIRSPGGRSRRGAGLWRSRHPAAPYPGGQLPVQRMLTPEQLECIFEQAKAESIPPREQLDPLLLPMDTAVASCPR